MENKIYNGTGRRKTSTARVFLKSGKGEITVNGKKLEDFFKRMVYLNKVKEPLLATKLEESVDVKCFVKGGGTTGQSGAISLGVARAVLKLNAELRPNLKSAKLLTRDSRKVERKKYGQKGARARFQYSKR